MKRDGNVETVKDEEVNVKERNSVEKYLERICEIMLNNNSTQVAYVVFDCGSYLKSNRKSYALPLTAIQYDSNKECFILNVDKEKLKISLGFANDHWSDMADMNWGDYISHYGKKSIWE